MNRLLVQMRRNNQGFLYRGNAGGIFAIRLFFYSSHSKSVKTSRAGAGRAPLVVLNDFFAACRRDGRVNDGTWFTRA